VLGKNNITKSTGEQVMPIQQSTGEEADQAQGIVVPLELV